MEELLSLLGAAAGFVVVIAIAIAVFALVCQWRMYVKMGEPGWKVLIPIYSDWVEAKHIFGHGAVMLIPIALAYIPKAGDILVLIAMFLWGIIKYKRFNKSTIVAILFAIFPFIGNIVVAFDNSEFNHDELKNLF